MATRHHVSNTAVAMAIPLRCVQVIGIWAPDLQCAALPRWGVGDNEVKGHTRITGCEKWIKGDQHNPISYCFLFMLPFQGTGKEVI